MAVLCQKPIPSSVPAGLVLISDFGFCYQCQAGSSLVLRRPIEITALTGEVKLRFIWFVTRRNTLPGGIPSYVRAMRIRKLTVSGGAT